jgi:hypothetical protein
LPASLLALLLAALALWLFPRRTREVISVDGEHRWEQDSAPARRQIVWQPAQAIAASARNSLPSDSLMRPQLAEGGGALYYTVKHAGGADIYRSAFDGRRWLRGEPVAALNSPDDDFGPVMSADGRELYLYSNRPGGQGGFDLYVSRRNESGWSSPENVGPKGWHAFVLLARSRKETKRVAEIRSLRRPAQRRRVASG